MVKTKEGYDFGFNQGSIKQESTINSIIESRLVPRDIINNFETLEGSREGSYLYVDNNGTPEKIELTSIVAGIIQIVNVLPATADDGQIVLLKRADGQYEFNVFHKNANGWEAMHIMSDAELVTFNSKPTLVASNVQAALEVVNTKVDNISEGGATKAEVQAVNTDLQAHKNNNLNPHSVNKAQVGLGNADNTSDMNKPISLATQAALNLKEDADITILKQDDVIDDLVSSDINYPLSANQGKNLNTDLQQHKNRQDNPHNVNKTQVGLSNVDNTSDLNKPISTATQSALDDKVNVIDIQDNLSSSATNKPLSANQGRVLNADIQTRQTTLSETNKLNINYIADLATVAKTNDYNDLYNKLVAGSNINIGTGNVIYFTNESLFVNAQYLTDNKYTNEARVQEMINQIKIGGITFSLISSLSQVKQPGIIYMLPVEEEYASANDLYDEYMIMLPEFDSEGKYIEGSGVVEHLGPKRILINEYAKKTYVTEKIAVETAAREDAIAGLTTLLNEKVAELNTAISTETTRATTAEGTLQTNINAEAQARQQAYAELLEKVNKKPEKEINSSDGKALLFNEADGGGAKFEHVDGTYSFVGVNNGGEEGIAAQLYAVDATESGHNLGAKLDITRNGMYYTTGAASGSRPESRDVTANELAVRRDVTDAVTSEATARASADTALQTNITNEVNARTSAINAVNESINQEATTREQADTTLTNSITAEKTRAEGAEATLTTNLSDEATTRAAADTTLGNRATALETGLATEKTAREDADTTLQGNITAEKTRAEGKEATLQTNITNEATTRATEDGKLDTKISTNAANITQEIADRTAAISEEALARGNADTSLGNRIDSEELARANADTALQTSIGTVSTNLATEVTNRTTADTALGTRITEETSARESADTTLQTNITGVSNRVTAVEGKIPTQASTTNQLADKEFVNSSIATSTATFRGTFNSVSELPTTGIDINDYAFVKSVDSAGNTVYSRYKYDGTKWVFEYSLNNSSFTAAQWAAINSGATAALIGKISTIEGDISSETSARIAADNTLQGNIDSEETARKAADTTLTNNLSAHIASASNPHGVTKEQVGLGNVTNTGDSATPVSGGTTKFTTGGAYTELAKKVNISDIKDNLTSTDTNKPLSANQGKELKGLVDAKASASDLSSHTTNKSNPHAVTAAQVGLDKVNNTSDADKPISTATQTALNAKASSSDLTAHTGNTNNPHSVTKAQVGLGSVVNTGDSATPVQNGTTKFTTGGAYTMQSTLNSSISNKVDKVSGKSLISDTDITKLSGIASGATKVETSTTNGKIKINGTESTVYTHPAYTATSGFNKITSDATGHISAGAAVTKSDITGLVNYSADNGSGLTYSESGASVKFKETYTGDITVSKDNWTAVEESGVTVYYKNEVTVSGVTANSSPTLDVSISPSDYANYDALNAAWSAVYSAQTSDGKITLYAINAPTISFNIQAKGY